MHVKVKHIPLRLCFPNLESRFEQDAGDVHIACGISTHIVMMTANYNYYVLMTVTGVWEIFRCQLIFVS